MPGEPIRETIIVRGSLSDVYQMWADFENFPVFMTNIDSVTKTGDGLSHWVMKGPLGARVEWEAETTRMEENRRIAWNSKDNSPVKTSGQVTFKELGPNETQVAVTLQYAAPNGPAGDLLAAVFADPKHRLREDLQRFKVHIESTATRLREAAWMR